MIAGISLSRILSVIAYITTIIVAMQVGGMFTFLPPKIAAFILALGATLTAFSERIQGGASTQTVSQVQARDAAAK